MDNSKITMEVPYFQVPNDIFEIGLDKHELLIYMYLARCGNHGSKAFPSYNKIAEKTGISRRKVIDTIKLLENKKLIVKEKRYNFERGENYSNVYRIEHDIKSTGSAQYAPPNAPYALCSEQDAPYKETDYKEFDYKEPIILHHLKNDDILHNLDELNHDRYIFIYLETMKDFGYKHKRISDKNFDYIKSAINEVKECDIDIEDWQEKVEEHFEKLPKSNDGDILAFLKAAARYFEVNIDCLARVGD